MNDGRFNQGKKNELLGWLILVSLLVHLPLVAILPRLLFTDELLDETGFDPTQEFTIELSEEPPEEPLYQVRLQEPEEESVPEKATVEDRFSEAVERETIRPPEPGDRAEVPVPRPDPPQPVEKPVEEDERIEEPSPEPEESAAAMEIPDGELPKPTEVEAVPEAPEEGRDTRALFPKWQDSVAATGERAPRQERFHDVDEGEENLLNRRHTKYWSFFDRLVEQIRPHWRPRELMMHHDPHGNVYGVSDRITVLFITLSSDGSLYQLRVLRSCGVDILDEEALRAVRRAAPFPNPPKGLQDSDGMIRFSFGFHLEVRHGQFRGPNIKWR
ncbi:MAG: energy transducer TonB family protein [Bradymonadaceae bacterium]